MGIKSFFDIKGLYEHDTSRNRIIRINNEYFFFHLTKFIILLGTYIIFFIFLSTIPEYLSDLDNKFKISSLFLFSSTDKIPRFFPLT